MKILWSETELAIEAVHRRGAALETMIRDAIANGINLSDLWVRVVEEPSDDVIERSDLMCNVEGLRAIVLGSFEIRRAS